MKYTLYLSLMLMVILYGVISMGRLNISGERVRQHGVPCDRLNTPSITRAVIDLPKVPTLATTTADYEEVITYVGAEQPVAQEEVLPYNTNDQEIVNTNLPVIYGEGEIVSTNLPNPYSDEKPVRKYR